MKFPRLIGAWLSVFVLLGLCACKADKPTETTVSKQGKPEISEDIPYEPPSASYELVTAACYGNNQRVKELLEKDTSLINKESFFLEEETTHTPLSCALHGTYKEGYTDKHKEVVKTLVSYGVDVNQIDPSGQDPMYCTPLQLAVSNDDVEITKLLIDNGANANLNVRIIESTPSGRQIVMGYCDSCLEIAKRKGNTEMINLLSSVGAEIDPPKTEITVKSIKVAYREIVEMIKQAGAKE